MMCINERKHWHKIQNEKSLTAVGRKVLLISFVERIGILNQSLNTLQTT